MFSSCGEVMARPNISEDEACSALLANVEGEPLADPRVLRFRAGRRKHSWSRNVIAVGLASGFLEPLESTSIYLAQMAITYLIELFPLDGRIDPKDRAEFNRLVDMEYDRVRDFLILHFHAMVRGDPGARPGQGRHRRALPGRPQAGFPPRGRLSPRILRTPQ